MPSKLAIIEIETDEDERLCSAKCPSKGHQDYCHAFQIYLVRSSGTLLRDAKCMAQTRLASLDRAVVEAAEAVAGIPPYAWRDEYESLKRAVTNRRMDRG